MFKKRCSQCGKPFQTKFRKRKYCSRKCYWKSKKGKIPHPITNEIKRKISRANTGRKHSEEDKIKMRIACKGRHSPMEGKHHSEATKRRMAQMRKGKHNSPDTEFKKGEHLREKHPYWKGGRIKDSYGYIILKNTSHPFRAKNNYIREHRLVIEKMIGRYLKRKEPVHHLGKKSDNRPHKLMAFTSNSAHKRFHKNPKNVKPEEIIFDGRILQYSSGTAPNYDTR